MPNSSTPHASKVSAFLTGAVSAVSFAALIVSTTTSSTNNDDDAEGVVDQQATASLGEERPSQTASSSSTEPGAAAVDGSGRQQLLLEEFLFKSIGSLGRACEQVDGVLRIFASSSTSNNFSSSDAMTWPPQNAFEAPPTVFSPLTLDDEVLGRRVVGSGDNCFVPQHTRHPSTHLHDSDEAVALYDTILNIAAAALSPSTDAAVRRADDDQGSCVDGRTVLLLTNSLQQARRFLALRLFRRALAKFNYTTPLALVPTVAYALTELRCVEFLLIDQAVSSALVPSSNVPVNGLLVKSLHASLVDGLADQRATFLSGWSRSLLLHSFCVTAAAAAVAVDYTVPESSVAVHEIAVDSPTRAVAAVRHIASALVASGETVRRDTLEKKWQSACLGVEPLCDPDDPAVQGISVETCFGAPLFGALYMFALLCGRLSLGGAAYAHDHRRRDQVLLAARPSPNMADTMPNTGHAAIGTCTANANTFGLLHYCLTSPLCLVTRNPKAHINSSNTSTSSAFTTRADLAADLGNTLSRPHWSPTLASAGDQFVTRPLSSGAEHRSAPLSLVNAEHVSMVHRTRLLHITSEVLASFLALTGGQLFRCCSLIKRRRPNGRHNNDDGDVLQREVDDEDAYAAAGGDESTLVGKRLLPFVTNLLGVVDELLHSILLQRRSSDVNDVDREAVKALLTQEAMLDFVPPDCGPQRALLMKVLQTVLVDLAKGSGAIPVLGVGTLLTSAERASLAEDMVKDFALTLASESSINSMLLAFASSAPWYSLFRTNLGQQLRLWATLPLQCASTDRLFARPQQQPSASTSGSAVTADASLAQLWQDTLIVREGLRQQVQALATSLDLGEPGVNVFRNLVCHVLIFLMSLPWPR